MHFVHLLCFYMLHLCLSSVWGVQAAMVFCILYVHAKLLQLLTF